jgi:hypothetical protein
MSTLALLAGSTIMQVGSQISTGISQSKAEQYNARVAESQAESARISGAFQSEVLKQQSKTELAQIERAKKKTLSTQRATYAKSGVRVNEGSPLDVMADTAAEYELDLATSRYNTQVGLESLRYDTETAVNRPTSEAEYRKNLAKQYKTSSYYQAGGTLLSGATTYKLLNPSTPNYATVAGRGRVLVR